MYVEFIIFKNPKKEFEVPTLQEKKKKESKQLDTKYDL